jgi:hypothetical protein
MAMKRFAFFILVSMIALSGCAASVTTGGHHGHYDSSGYWHED